MTEADFLADANVREFVEWLRTRIGGGGRFVHQYIDRRTGRPWKCDGLFNAFRQYDWKEQAWKATKATLDKLREELRAAVAANDADNLSAACKGVLQWGGVSARNSTYIEEHRGVLLDEVTHLLKVLSADHEPLTTDILRNPTNPKTQCRMNSGFVKIYSLLLDHFVIYDGRVGAALGLFVRMFCEESGLPTVPPLLAFAYGLPKNIGARAPKRNPTMGLYHFRALDANNYRHCLQAMRASWLLRETLAAGVTPFTVGEDGFHELAAGLFMVGYDLSCSHV